MYLPSKLSRSSFSLLAAALLLGQAACSVEAEPGEASGDVADSLSAADVVENAHLLVLVRSDQGAFSIVGSRRVEGALPKRRGETKQAGWSFRAAAPNGTALHQGMLENPHALRGDFKDELTGATQGVAVTRGGPATFALRVPLGTKLLELFEQQKPAAAAARAAGATPFGTAASSTPPGAVRLGSVSLP